MSSQTISRDPAPLAVSTSKMVLPDADWPPLLARVRALVPEAFDNEGYALNLLEGRWGETGHGKYFLSPVDGSELGKYPMIDLETAKRAVRFAADEFRQWRMIDLDERKRRLMETVSLLREHADLIAWLLVWEIGKPFAQAAVSVERCLSGVTWYVENIEPMLEGRQPIGLISNIASWNYPMSVLMPTVLVQALAGNAVIAKTPSDGGLYALTLAMALAGRVGLPVSLVSGSGGQLSDALVRNEALAGLAFVGGKSNGRDIAASLYDQGHRYIREMEGVNAYPRNCRLYHSEPFGPLDSIVVVDRMEELIAELNVSNGCLVASIACDDPKAARRIADELRSFKVGINQVRSRGDRQSASGVSGSRGKDASWAADTWWRR